MHVVHEPHTVMMHCAPRLAGGCSVQQVTWPGFQLRIVAGQLLQLFRRGDPACGRFVASIAGPCTKDLPLQQGCCSQECAVAMRSVSVQWLLDTDFEDPMRCAAGARLCCLLLQISGTSTPCHTSLRAVMAWLFHRACPSVQLCAIACRCSCTTMHCLLRLLQVPRPCRLDFQRAMCTDPQTGKYALTVAQRCIVLVLLSC